MIFQRLTRFQRFQRFQRFLTMTTTLENIKTIKELYQLGALSVAHETYYPPINVLNEKVSIWRGDITTLKLDAIVNAANKTLLGGGGVDGAIHRAAGRQLLEACKLLNGCQTGDAKITPGFNLPSKYVIHTVGPIYPQEGEKSSIKLQSSYKRCFEILSENNLSTIAFPCISTGAYSYPHLEAAHISLETTRRYLESTISESLAMKYLSHKRATSPMRSQIPSFQSINSDIDSMNKIHKIHNIDRVVFCIHGEEDWDIYCKLVPLYFPPSRGHEKDIIEQQKWVMESTDPGSPSNTSE